MKLKIKFATLLLFAVSFFATAQQKQEATKEKKTAVLSDLLPSWNDGTSKNKSLTL